jgi:uncharacterized membrane protein
VAAACAALAIWLSTLGPAEAPRQRQKRAEAPAPAAVTFRQVEEIVASRCSMCHAAEPVWLGIERAPKGVRLDAPALIAAHAREIAVSAAWSSAMPPSNITGMTATERDTIAAWARQPR